MSHLPLPSLPPSLVLLQEKRFKLVVEDSHHQQPQYKQQPYQQQHQASHVAPKQATTPPQSLVRKKSQRGPIFFLLLFYLRCRVLAYHLTQSMSAAIESRSSLSSPHPPLPGVWTRYRLTRAIQTPWLTDKVHGFGGG